MIFRFLGISILAMFLVGCAGTIKTNQVSIQSAVPVPVERLFAFQQPAEGLVKITVTRDSGVFGSGCFLGLSIAGQLAARIDPNEKGEFFVPPGKVQMSATIDPQGKGLCGLEGFTAVVDENQVEPNGPNVFRISSRMYRRPRVIPAF